MLSAVAARKAALAASQDEPQPTESSYSQSLKPEASLKPALSRPSSKRKSNYQKNPIVTKKKRSTKAPEKPAQSFSAQDGFKAQEDMIVIESDEDQRSNDDAWSVDTLSEDLPSKPSATPSWSPSHPVIDSSEDEEQVVTHDFGLLNSHSATQRADSPEPVITSFQACLGENIFVLSSADLEELGLGTNPSVALVLSPSENLCLLGVCALYVLHGCIGLNGAVLSASATQHRIFAPKSSPLPTIECCSQDTPHKEPVRIPRRLHSVCRDDNAAILLQELQTGVESLGRICRTFHGVFGPLPNSLERDCILSGVQLIQFPNKDVFPSRLPRSWLASLLSVGSDDENTKPEIYLVKGPKRSGKSTFAIALLNRLLSRYRRVAFLECDLGQSEFTPAGMVALNVIDRPVFGPAFTHPTIPNIAHYIGATTPRSSPSHYLESIESILQTYRFDIQTPPLDIIHEEIEGKIADCIPLVVNTMGWTKGLGADLIRSVEDMIQPTHVFEIEAPTRESGLHPVPVDGKSDGAHSTPKTVSLEPAPLSFLSTKYTPADHRSLSILSFLYAVFPNKVPGEIDEIAATSWDVTLPLCACPPYEVDCTAGLDNLVLAGAGMEDVVPSEIQYALNGAIVGMVNCEEGAFVDADNPTDLTSMELAIPYVQGSAPPTPSSSRCFGLALIRSVSPTLSDMHVLTSIPSSMLAQCRVMVKGELELPIWGMLDFRYEGHKVAGVDRDKVPYLQWGKGEGVGSQRRRVRRNLMRRGQM